MLATNHLTADNSMLSLTCNITADSQALEQCVSKVHRQSKKKHTKMFFDIQSTKPDRL